MKNKVMLFQEAINSGHIRKTDDNKVSVIDVIEAMTGKDARHAAEDFNTIKSRHPEVSEKIGNIQFPGQGQRPKV